ncbi:MAG: phage portal protein [Oscillospiraceae bacterium]
MVTEKELLRERIRAGGGMKDEEFFAEEISRWLSSKKREDMLSGKGYYRGEQDILKRRRTVISGGGGVVEVGNLPNNQMVNNLYGCLVDQKKNYLLGKPLTILAENKVYEKLLRGILGKKFLRTIKLGGEEALNCGISWLYPYFGEGEIRFRLFSGSEICPFWADGGHTELDCAARVYGEEVYEGREKKQVTRVELYGREGISAYTLEGGRLIPQREDPYVKRGEQDLGWGKIPLIPMKYNAGELPLLNRVRQLQDGYNLILSDFVNTMEENVHNTILVLKNYDGTDLGEFRRNLAAYGAVKTRTVEGASGGVDTLHLEVNGENYRTVLSLLRRGILENGRGFDSFENLGGGNPNQMNIESRYVGLDLDANEMETELQAVFEDVLLFVNRFLFLSGKGDFRGEPVEVLFNRDMLINESEAIENCVKSVGILPREVILANHPWSR